MGADDLPAVIALDAAQAGREREEFLARKWHAASQAPGTNIALVAHQGDELTGYLLGQVFYGAFGMTTPRAVLDTVLVGERWRRNQVGHALLRHFRAQLAALRINLIGTLVAWNRRDLLGFLDAMGFYPSRDQHLVWDLARYPFTPQETDAVVRAVRPQDLAHVVAIDLEEVPASRKLYITAKQKAHEAAPAWHPFLVAEMEGLVAGFAVGAVCRGEFGIDTPRGIVDSLGVGLAWRQLGVGSALLGELSAQLRAMGIQQIETMVRWNNWSLLQFFDYAGFRPSTRLILEWRGG
jgi:GNAT superfamily N-acetyltransferase